MSLEHMVCATGRTMPGMTCSQCSFYCICSHVGYTKPDSRLETCPGQRAQTHNCRSATCPGQRAHKFRSRQLACSEQRSQPTKSNCPGQQDRNMAQSREHCARIDDTLEELKFWTMSSGCKIVRDCLREVPSSWRSFDCSRSDWWKEPGLTERRKTLRELTTCELTHVVDTQCLRDTEGSASRHLGTNVINMRGMCHNVCISDGSSLGTHGHMRRQ